MIDELQHHGILGMKWGVRRYQNYDGSYTQQGLKRYREAEAKYESSKQNLATAKASGNKEDVKRAKRRVTFDRNNLVDAYDLDVKRGNRVDRGKKLYASGKREGDLWRKAIIDQVTIAGISSVIGTAIEKLGKNYVVGRSEIPIGTIGAATVSAGATITKAILAGKAISDIKNYRAYYGP